MPPQLTNGPSKRAPHTITKPYICKPKAAKVSYKSSAKPLVRKRTHLTLGDWLHVVEWYDQNQPVSQDATVKHYQNLREGALIFDQASLSHHLTKKGRQKDQEKLAATPTALSAKKARIVTRPDVEKALRLWVEHMEQRRETVTGAMLVEKRARFEDKLDVPENERL